jgi:peptidyl-prolyl cis-trans isomerase B (cyclophilin B)
VQRRYNRPFPIASGSGVPIVRLRGVPIASGRSASSDVDPAPFRETVLVMNKLHFVSRLFPFVLSAALSAQDTEYPPDLPIPEDAVTARLETSLDVVPVGGRFKVTLVAEFKRQVQVSQTLLGGHFLLTYINERQSRTAEKVLEGLCTIAAGTVLQRTVDVDLAAVFKGEKIDDNARLTVVWSGVPGATSTVQLIPDQTGLDLDTLDLAKSKVKLMTNFGEMVVTFRPDKAPGHVRNFVKLAKDGFYNGTKFHRVIKGFMIQGGCPNTKKGAGGMPGTGDPGYKIQAEFNDLKHVRGVLSMARSTDPNSAGCQFFIMDGDNPGLDGSYTIFGMLESGFETLDKIVSVRVRPTQRGEVSDPVEPIELRAVVVVPYVK